MNRKASENGFLSGIGVRDLSCLQMYVSMVQHGVSTCLTTTSLQHNIQGLNFDLTKTMVMVHTKITLNDST